MVVPDLGRRSERTAPAADDAGLAAEQEAVAIEVGYDRIRDRAGWGATRNRHDETQLRPTPGVEGGFTRPVVGDPPRARREAGESPRVDEVGVGRRSRDQCVDRVSVRVRIL